MFDLSWLQDHWKKMASLPTARLSGPSLIVQENGHVIVVGGNNETFHVDIMRQPITEGGKWEVSL